MAADERPVEQIRVTAAHLLGGPRGELWRLIGGLIVSLSPLLFGTCWGIRETHIAAGSEIAASEGFRYSVVIAHSVYEPLFRADSDGVRYPRRSGTRLYEGERQLGPPHRPHDFIRADGLGQFSHWGSTLSFSSSDNTDPRANGRTYSVVTAATLSFESVGVWILCVLASASVAYWLRRTRRDALALPRAWMLPAGALIATTYFLLVRYSIAPEAAAAVPRRQLLMALWAASLGASILVAGQIGLLLGGVSMESIEAIQSSWDRLLTRIGRPLMQPGLRGLSWRAASVAFAFVVFGIVLRVPMPYSVLVASYFFATPLVVPFGLVLWCCYLRKDWIGTVASLTVTLALFALPLASLWWHVGTHYNAVGGLLPFSDASGYYYDARRLIDGYPFGWSARRPLFPGLLATLLALTGQNLQVTLAVFAALNAVAVFLLARELRVSHGPTAAAVATLVLFLFYRIDGGLGTALTENLGLAMGTIAFAALWRGSRARDLLGVSVGLGLLTIALMARAGAFFVLPALVLAIVVAFRENRRSMRAGVIAIAAVILSAGLTLVVSRLLSDPAGEQTAFSNFSYSLYGLVVGGKGWNQALQDHPGAAEGAEIYSLAWQAFRAHPMSIVEGSVKMLATYFQPAGPHHVFAFVHDGTYGPWLQIVCYVLGAIGLVSAFRGWREPHYTVILAATFGHLASVPLVPPIDAGLRVYAATMGIVAILVSVGAAAAVQGVRHLAGIAARPVVSDGQGASAATGYGRSAEFVGIAITAVVFAGPLTVLYTGRSRALSAPSCPEGTTAAVVRLSAGSFLRVTDDLHNLGDAGPRVPEIRRSDIRASATATELKNDAGQFTAGKTMANLYDLKTNRLLWLVAPTDGPLSASPGIFQICGRDTADPLSRNYAVFYGHAVARVIPGAGSR